MNIAFLNIQAEIKRIIKDLGIPIDGLNFMPGGRQAELRYKNKTIGYILCSDEDNAMSYQTQDILAQKHLDWSFVFQQNRAAITQQLTKALKKAPASIVPGAFRQISVKFDGDKSMLVDCWFDGNGWILKS